MKERMETKEIREVIEQLCKMKDDVMNFQELLTKDFLQKFNIDNIATADHYYKTLKLSDKALEFIQSRIKRSEFLIESYEGIQ